jgi:hypothetical protein
MTLTSIPTIDEALAVVESMEGVTRIVAGTGQILVHRNHTPFGFFVIVEGTLVLSDGASIEFVRADNLSGPVLVPAMGELELPAWRSARVEVGAVVLYLPRSLALFDAHARGLIEDLELRAVSLQPPRTFDGPANTHH